MEEQADPAEAGSSGGNEVGLREELTITVGAVAHALTMGAVAQGPCAARNDLSASA